MTLALIAVATGLGVGYARGGRLSRLAGLRPRRNRLLLTALGLHAAGVLGSWLYEPALAVCAAISLLTLAYYAWLNRVVHGAGLVAVGLAANAVVLLVNGAVPVSLDATTRAGADPAMVTATGHHEPASAGTRLPWLGEVVPVAFPPRPEVVSPGDIAVAAGLAVILAMGMAAGSRVVSVDARATMADQPAGRDSQQARPDRTMHPPAPTSSTKEFEPHGEASP